MVIDWTWGAGLATSFAGGGPKEPACQCRRDQRLSSIPALGISPRGGNGTPPVFRSGESHGQRSLAGYSPWGRQESDTTWQFKLRTQDPRVSASYVGRAGVGTGPGQPTHWLAADLWGERSSARPIGCFPSGI